MSRHTKQHSQQFKQDAVKYVMEHPDLTVEECARNFGVGLSTLSRWRQQYAANDGTVPTRGSGNYDSDEQKEIARLKRELRDAQDALDVLKKHRHSGKRLTTAIYIEVAARMETAKAARRRVSLSGMLRFLGVSRSGYRAFLSHRPSESQLRKERIKKPMHLQPIYRTNAFVTVQGNGRGRSNAYIAGSGVDVGADIFRRGLCLPSDNKMTPEQ